MDNIRKKTEVCLDKPTGNNTASNNTSETKNTTQANSDKIVSVDGKQQSSISAPNTGISGDSILPLLVLLVIFIVASVLLFKKGKRFVVFAFIAVSTFASFNLLNRSAMAVIPGCQKVGYSDYDIIVDFDQPVYYDGKFVNFVKVDGTGDSDKDDEMVNRILDNIDEIRTFGYLAVSSASIIKPHWDAEEQFYSVHFDEHD
ncbi:hypothetical protein BVE84_02295 [Streptococcus azizii]|uniref:LPXTG cell wall anchor domain-containing protein n=1 Tax=Streptococcus azizii TaxID=1579424 RepID=A0AB36JSR1_9STRE|nr:MULTISPECIES: LPXTG cell wall anchor domain-containing protein [Streptococcus]MBF0775359.1 LPXTG cell wall anchor domain-containing protein [Streptococcus sp. 19428wD3_AN2]ONK29628.1 hypothetical protein BVE86_00985 [Streptococcus azizii]ONK30136.1 hypothetical protein BVE85_02295 [Streptococcus azizii]ONK30912.1 hypothetical protein BVE84_02295 [Streptococcus azizii]TFU84882.1 LPXTG cell wall anchor domain-containing protein [Streptococcus sp. AN2]